MELAAGIICISREFIFLSRHPKLCGTLPSDWSHLIGVTELYSFSPKKALSREASTFEKHSHPSVNTPSAAHTRGSWWDGDWEQDLHAVLTLASGHVPANVQSNESCEQLGDT